MPTMPTKKIKNLVGGRGKTVWPAGQRKQYSVTGGPRIIFCNLAMHTIRSATRICGRKKRLGQSRPHEEPDEYRQAGQGVSLLEVFWKDARDHLGRNLRGGLLSLSRWRVY